MLDKKVGIFSAFIFFGIAALFFPATVLENSIANAQEELVEEVADEEMYSLSYEEGEESSSNGYYNNDSYEENYYDPYKDNIKKDPIVKIKKNLFICEDVQSEQFFRCVEQSTPVTGDFPAEPDSGRYIECTDEELCPLVDESDFNAQIFKDVATVHDLSPQGTPVNLDKFHYTVTEGDISEINTGDGFCEASGFNHGAFHQAFIPDTAFVQYQICVKYVGDCDGIIYPGEVKTCTIENYIYQGSIVSTQNSNVINSDDNGATTGSTTPTNTTTTDTTQSNDITEEKILSNVISRSLDALQ